MKVQITEQDYHNMLVETLVRLIDSGILLERAKKIVGPAVRAAQRELKAHVAQMVANRDPRIQKVANNIGINFDFDADNRRQQLQSLVGDDGNIVQSVMDEVLHAADILSRYTASNGSFDRTDGEMTQMQRDFPDEYDNLMRMKDFIDQIGMTHLYDRSFMAKPSKKRYLNGRFGVTIDDEGNLDTSNFDLSNVDQKQVDDYIKVGTKKNPDGTPRIPRWAEGRTNEELFDIVKRRKVTSMLNTYMASKYGLRVNMPTQMFAAGNAKVADDTLIINFASAQRCPAWNECIVKHACYARGTEHFRQNVRDANTQRNLMWATGERDEEMLRLLFNLVKAYTFNYAAAAKELGMLMDELRNMELSEIQDENIIHALQNNRNVINLRLNEDGDFIAQWLVEAWNDFAGQLRRFGVVTTCYTCRNLNFKGIENIIINASNTGIKGPGVKRYFFAVKEDMYDAFDETYNGPDNALIFEPGENGKTKITPNIQPLYDDNGRPNGNFYYKCPCGRTDGIGTSSEGKVDCYQCRTCYEPTVVGDGRPYYVFVKVHGAAKGDFRGRTTPFGVSKNYWANMERIHADENNDGKLNKGTMDESLEGVMGNVATAMANPMVAGARAIQQGVRAFSGKDKELGRRKAVRQICRNAINSMNDHLKNL